MAKRSPVGEKPYRPVDEALVRAVMIGAPAVGEGSDGNAALANAPQPMTAPASRVALVPARENDPIPPRVVVEGPRDLASSINEPTNELAEYAEPRNREKRVLLTRPEERDIERLVARLATELGTPVKLSHLLRASITMLLHSEQEVMERAKRTKLVRPGNGNGPELAEFEHGLATILSTAFRETRPLR